MNNQVQVAKIDANLEKVIDGLAAIYAPSSAEGQFLKNFKQDYGRLNAEQREVSINQISNLIKQAKKDLSSNDSRIVEVERAWFRYQAQVQGGVADVSQATSNSAKARNYLTLNSRSQFGDIETQVARFNSRYGLAIAHYQNLYSQTPTTKSIFESLTAGGEHLRSFLELPAKARNSVVASNALIKQLSQLEALSWVTNRAYELGGPTEANFAKAFAEFKEKAKEFFTQKDGKEIFVVTDSKLEAWKNLRQQIGITDFPVGTEKVWQYISDHILSAATKMQIGIWKTNHTEQAQSASPHQNNSTSTANEIFEKLVKLKPFVKEMASILYKYRFEGETREMIVPYNTAEINALMNASSGNFSRETILYLVSALNKFEEEIKKISPSEMSDELWDDFQNIADNEACKILRARKN
ncbi:MAG: hypothetical protein NZO16_05225 [Deltaproteobacteria bacterium]|nr:hypothetical protein [Deltaproteobacteria bacterium]